MVGLDAPLTLCAIYYALFAIAMLDPMPTPAPTLALTFGYCLAMPTLAKHIHNVHLKETGDQMWNCLLYTDEIPFPIMA